MLTLAAIGRTGRVRSGFSPASAVRPAAGPEPTQGSDHQSVPVGSEHLLTSGLPVCQQNLDPGVQSVFVLFRGCGSGSDLDEHGAVDRNQVLDLHCYLDLEPPVPVEPPTGYL